MMMKRLLWLSLLLLASCAGPAVKIDYYSLEAKAPPGLQRKLPVVLLVSEPRAAAGYDSARMAYQLNPNRIDYFAKNQWLAPPNKMLLPLMLRELDRSFGTVVSAMSPGNAELRLDTEIMSLRQEFSGGESRVRMALRAQLFDLRNRKAIATAEFEVLEPAAPDPYGGVVAANRAAGKLLSQLGEFCLRGAKSAFY